MSNSEILEIQELMKHRRFHEALRRLQELGTSETDPMILFNLGVVHKKLGQPFEALDAFEKASELAPDQAEIWNEIGLIYDEMGKVSAAENFYKKALELSPEFASAWNNWGVLAFIRGQFPEARERFEKAVAIEPDNLNAWFNLRDTFRELGEEEAEINAQKQLDRLGGEESET